MIPLSSSSPISGAVSSGLSWSKIPRSRDYELKRNGETVGALRRSGWFATGFLAETQEGRWTFRRGGCFSGGAEILDSASQRRIATFKSSWGTGGGTLTFADGQNFQLRVAGWWRPVWSVLAESGETLLRLHARGKTVELPPSTQSPASIPTTRLSLLSMFTFYRVLQAEEDAALAVMVAAS
jgi:hypothetical protein